MSARGKLLAVIGDEDVCTGFILGGVGEINKSRQPNYLVVKNDTTTTEIEDHLKYEFICIFHLINLIFLGSLSIETILELF